MTRPCKTHTSMDGLSGACAESRPVRPALNRSGRASPSVTPLGSPGLSVGSEGSGWPSTHLQDVACARGALDPPVYPRGSRRLDGDAVLTPATIRGRQTEVVWLN